MARGSLPKRQRLVGLWLLLSGISLLGGAIFALWLDSQLNPEGLARAVLWLGCFSGGGTIFLVGLLLERQLFIPLRHLHVLLARLAANPDARADYPPEGWLRGLGPDIDRVREVWRADRERLATAHTEGARSAARIRHELEALLQVLDTPLLLCDRHHRMMLFNHAAETLFKDHPGLGLGKRLEAILDASSLQEALRRLPDDGTSRELLLPYGERWLRCTLRRVPDSHGETLLTLTDATAAWSSEVGARACVVERLPSLRRHGASLASAAEALGSVDSATPDHVLLRERLEAVIDEESQAMSEDIAQLGSLLEAMQRQGERLAPMWSNDLFQALNERLSETPLQLVPIGIPAWLKADPPALLTMLEALLERLTVETGVQRFDAEVLLGNKRVYLDLIWPGKPLRQLQLTRWCDDRLDSLPLSPTIGDLLRQHASDIWSLTDDGRHARLRLPLPADERVGPPPSRPAPRPEFHDFGIADLPPPDAELAACPLRQLEVVSFDTETTGLELRRCDSVISIGACRIVNARLLADDTFDQRIDPGRPIPPSSTAIHGLTDSDVAGAPPLPVVLPRFRDYIGDAVLLAHNAAFDLLAIQPPGAGIEFRMPVLDTLLISRALDEGLDGHDLDTLADRYDLTVPAGARHTALGDARLTAELWLTLLPRLEARGIDTLHDLLTLQAGAFDKEDASA